MNSGIHGYLVRADELLGTNKRIPNYSLLKDDILVRGDDGKFTKEAPGLCVVGFELSDEMIADLEPITFRYVKHFVVKVDGKKQVDGRWVDE